MIYSIKVHHEYAFQYDDANFDADVVVSTYMYWCFSVKNNNTPLNAADRGKAVGKGGSKLRLMLRLKNF